MARPSYEEALRIADEILLTFRENRSFSVTNLLRRCAIIAEILELDDILWINNELKGYPDDDVPPYRKIETQCQYSWFGSLPQRIADRELTEQFYNTWNENIIIRTSSVMLESWAKRGHSIELRRGRKLGVNVSEVANVKSEQYWEILHRIADKIREFASRIEKKLANYKTSTLKSEKQVTAFLSASFSDEIDWLISWFRKIIKSLDIEVIWLKEKFQAKPVEEKIKENICLCNCFIQIITKNVYEKGKEAGWIGNEIAWAKDSSPDDNMAIFVEKGVVATGLAREVADNLYFDPKNLLQDAPNIVQYLIDLKNRVLHS